MSKNDILIRLMTKSDLEEVASLYTAVYAQTSVDEKWTKETSYLLMKHCFSKQPDLCFVAVIDSKIVGCFTAGIKPWCDGNHLVDGEILVDSQYQKHQIGSKLSKVVYMTAIKKYKIANIDFITFNTGFPLSWYEKQGFKVNDSLVLLDGDPKEVINKLTQILLH